MTTTNPFAKATKTLKPLKIAIAGPTGSGKTRWMLDAAAELAKLMGSDKGVAVIETEQHRIDFFAEMHKFDALYLTSFKPEYYMAAITAAIENGYGVLGIDSLTHAWVDEGGVLQRVNNTGGNNYTDGWGKVGTPLQRKFIKSIIDSPIPIIATMRSKMEYVVEVNDRGKSVPRKVGMKPVQRDDVEYDFDVVLALDMDNAATIVKIPPVPGMEVGDVIDKTKGGRYVIQKVYGWLSSDAVAPTPKSAPKLHTAADVPTSWGDTFTWAKDLGPAKLAEAQKLQKDGKLSYAEVWVKVANG